MLVFGFVVGESLGVFFDDEPSRAGWRAGQDRVRSGDAAVADPLLVAVDLVADDAAILHHAVGGGAKSAEIAARFRFGRAVGEEQSFIGDAAQPDFLLVVRRTNRDGIAAEKSSQHRGCDSEIDARHLLANAVDVEGAAAHAAELFGDEQELDAQLVRAAHIADDLDGALVALIEFDQDFIGQALLGKFLERLHAEFQGLLCKHLLILTWRQRRGIHGLCWLTRAGIRGGRPRFRHRPPERWEPWDSC